MSREFADSPASETPPNPDRPVTDARHNPPSSISRRRCAVRVGALLVLASLLVAVCGYEVWHWMETFPIKTIEIETTPARHFVYDVVVSPNGDELMTSHGSRLPGVSDIGTSELRLWTMPDCRSSKRMETSPGESSRVFSPCGRHIAIAGPDDIRIVERATMNEVRRFVSQAHPTFERRRVGFSLDGKKIAALDALDNVVVWDLTGDSNPRRIDLGPFGPWAYFAFGTDPNHLLALSSSDNHYLLNTWNIAKKEIISSCPIDVGDSPVVSVAFSTNRESVALITARGEVNVWSIGQKRRTLEFQCPPGFEGHDMKLVQFASDNRYLITSGTNFRRFPMLVNSPPFIEIERQVVSEIKLWSVDSGRCLNTWQPEGFISCIRDIPNSHSVATLQFDVEGEWAKLNFWSLPVP